MDETTLVYLAVFVGAAAAIVLRVVAWNRFLSVVNSLFEKTAVGRKLKRTDQQDRSGDKPADTH
jgi:hypothetical protein